MRIHKAIIKKDIKKCTKKRWYPGIELEVKRIVKLLNIEFELPGEFPRRGFKGELSGKILHARINLPNSSFGKRKGPRLVYFKTDKVNNIKVLYVGGHKDKNYESNVFSKEITFRCLDEDNFINFDDFVEKINTLI